MKKFLFAILLCFLFMMPISAKNNIYSIDMDIYLDEFGNANIKEIWEVKGSDGTEWYKGYGDVGNMELSNFKVRMDNTNLTYKKWNVDESLSAKKGYYGIINKSNGYELCFGKYDYDKHTFTLEYTLSNAIFNTSDAQVLYNTLIDRLSDVNFENFSVEISSYYSFPNTLDVWGFGYKGYAYVEDGKIKMSNDGKMGSQYVVLLAKFPSNTFKTNNEYSKYSTFDSVLTKAEEGSHKNNVLSSISWFSKWLPFILIAGCILIYAVLTTIIRKYGNGNNGILIPILIMFFFSPVLIFNPLSILIIFLIIYSIKNAMDIYGYQNNKKIKKKEVPYIRDIPSKDICYANALLHLNGWHNNHNNIMGAMYLKWIRNHFMEVQKDEKGKTRLLLKRDNPFTNDLEKEVYDILLEASKDDILEEKELEKWARNHYSRYIDLTNRLKIDTIEKLKVDGFIRKRENINECRKKWVMNDTIYEDSVKLYGLKKFLLHFANMKEKEAIEVHLWDSYLMYAYLFGIADKVSKQFKKLYPEVIEKMQQDTLDLDTIIWINHVSIRSVSAANSARAAAQSYSSGGGGFSSSGGGGGSFGGGGGGGSR